MKRNSNLFPYELLALNLAKKGLDCFNNNTAAWEVRGAGEALQRSILTHKEEICSGEVDWGHNEEKNRDIQIPEKSKLSKP